MRRNSGTPQPKCHEHKKLAKMRVLKNIFKPNDVIRPQQGRRGRGGPGGAVPPLSSRPVGKLGI